MHWKQTLVATSENDLYMFTGLGQPRDWEQVSGIPFFPNDLMDPTFQPSLVDPILQNNYVTSFPAQASLSLSLSLNCNTSLNWKKVHLDGSL